MMDLAKAFGMEKKPHTLPEDQRQDVEGDAACFSYSPMEADAKKQEPKTLIGENIVEDIIEEDF